MNYIDFFKKHIDELIIGLKYKKYALLSNINYIEQIKQELLNGNISNIDSNLFESLIKKIDIEEDDIFFELKESLEEFSINIEELTNNITKEKEIDLIITTFGYLKEFDEYKDDLEPELVEKYISVLIKIIESLYDKEVQKIHNLTEYNQIDSELKVLEEILSIVNRSDNEVLNQEEKNKIYKFLNDSSVENKINIYIELGKLWIEQIKKLDFSQEQELIEPINLVIDPEEIENVQEEQREKLEKLAEKMTKNDWEQEITKAISLLNSSDKIKDEEKQILKRILMLNLEEPLEDINLAKDLIDELNVISLSSRINEYLESNHFEITEICADLIIHLIPNLDNPEVLQIINEIINKFEKIYLTQKEIDEVSKLIQSEYSTVIYTEYVDERIIDLEEKFIELNYIKERILNYDNHNNKLLQTNEQYIQFIKNTYKKIIRKKIEDLKELLVICNNNGLIVRNKLISLKNEIDTIIQKYEHELLVTEIEQPYKEYTIEEVENLTFNNKNAIIFLNGEKDKKLYEEGLLKNGENKNKIINESSRADLKLIMYLLVNNTIQLSNSSYGRFIDNIQYKRKNGSWDDVRINDKSLKRASLNHKQARISLIRLKVAEENKRKLGISSNQGVILILGAYEINFGNEEETYNQMFAEARYFEEKISKIMQIFENPNTSKETLLKYIADSYGLLQHLIEGTSTQDLNQTIETEQTDKNKRGGRN